jgi:hypothetical protein
MVRVYTNSFPPELQEGLRDVCNLKGRIESRESLSELQQRRTRALVERIRRRVLKLAKMNIQGLGRKPRLPPAKYWIWSRFCLGDKKTHLNCCGRKEHLALVSEHDCLLLLVVILRHFKGKTILASRIVEHIRSEGRAREEIAQDGTLGFFISKRITNFGTHWQVY